MTSVASLAESLKTASSQEVQAVLASLSPEDRTKLESCLTTPCTGPLKVLICGGGNGAHTVAALAGAKDGVEVRWLSLFADEAQRIETAMGPDTLKCETKDGVIESRPAVITNDPAKAVPGAQLIIFSLPAFGHAEYFEKIGPHMDDNCVLVGMPGRAGFQFQAAKLLGEKGKTCSVLCLETMPWACRIKEFGRVVEALGTKDEVSTSVNPMARDPTLFTGVAAMQRCLGEFPKVTAADNYLTTTLFSLVHPCIMYGEWKDWDGKPLAEKPLFYQGLSEFAADMLSKCSDELVECAKKINATEPKLDMSGVLHIFDWYKKAYGNDISDFTNLHSAMRTCKAYEGLRHPMKEVEGGLAPDWNYRYLSEDIPFGLCVVKGICELAEVPTPATDETLLWCQKTMGKEFLVDGKLCGKDVTSTRAPQAFGFTTLQQLIDLAGAK